jgi:GMP reductase
MRIEDDSKLDYKDVLIRPKRSTLGSRKDVELEREFTFRNYHSDTDEHYRGIPIMASNMDGVGTFEMADSLASMGLFTCLVKNYEADELSGFFGKDNTSRTENVAYSTGITSQDFEKFEAVYKQTGSRLKYVCVDVANGYSERFSDFIKQLRDAYPGVVIIAGNVVTGEMTEELILSGADIVKVGIGPGSVCTTRSAAILLPMAVAPVRETSPRLLRPALILSCSGECLRVMTKAAVKSLPVTSRPVKSGKLTRASKIWSKNVSSLTFTA